MRTFQSPPIITGSAGAMAVVPPAGMMRPSREPGELWSHLVYGLVAISCIVVGYYQFHIIVRRILALAQRQHGIRALAYFGLFWLGLGFVL
ncbi:MAG: hypothetical protein ACRETR_00390, partial [Steroidobacteraceae bacterium]